MNRFLPVRNEDVSLLDNTRKYFSQLLTPYFTVYVLDYGAETTCKPSRRDTILSVRKSTLIPCINFPLEL